MRRHAFPLLLIRGAGPRHARRRSVGGALVLALALFVVAPVGAQDLPEPPTPVPAETEPQPEPQAEPQPARSAPKSQPEPEPLDHSGVEPEADEADADANAATAPEDPRTAAERDFDAIYGGDQYDPVSGSSAPAGIRTTYDPWERYNRRIHQFNNAVDRTIALPLARTYVRVLPRPVRLGVSNFFSNLGQPVSAVNALLQGKPRQAAQAVGRFALNTTLGIGGIFDPASDAQLPHRNEDFGQTLGVWGWERSRYVELPLFGPRTVRDSLGLFGDAPLSPLRQVNEDSVRVPLQGLQLVDVRAQLMSTDSLRAGAADDYALVRDAWSQRRQYQIFGDRRASGEEALPDYLMDDSIPIIPAGAMPVIPGDTY